MRIFWNGKQGEISISNINYNNITYKFKIDKLKIGRLLVYDKKGSIAFTDRMGPVLMIEGKSKYLPLKYSQDLIDYVWENAPRLDRNSMLYSYTSEYKANYCD